MEQTQNLPKEPKIKRTICPRCGSSHIKKNGWNATHDRRQYKCKCGANFVYPLKQLHPNNLYRAKELGKETAKEIEPINKLSINKLETVPEPEIPEIMPMCPKCLNNSAVHRCGWNEKRDRRQYQCKVCSHRFVYPKKPKSEYMRDRKEKESLPTFDYEALKQHHIKILNSCVFDTPCFLCESLKFCEPSECKRLMEWCQL